MPFGSFSVIVLAVGRSTAGADPPPARRWCGDSRLGAIAYQCHNIACPPKMPIPSFAASGSKNSRAREIPAPRTDLVTSTSYIKKEYEGFHRINF